MMHILFVQPQPCIRALKYAEGLRTGKFRIRLSFAYMGKTLTQLYGHGDECFDAWYPLGDNPKADLKRIVDANNISLIHSHNAPDTLTNLCLDLFGRKIPIVHDIHDLMSARKTRYEDGVFRMDDMTNWCEEERRSIEHSDAVIAVSDEILNLAQQLGYHLPKLTHVYSNYTLKRFVPITLPRIDHNMTDRPIRIVYEGFISNNAGHYDLRAIFISLAAEGIEVHIYPSRANAEYQDLANTSSNIVYHESLSPEKLFEEIKHYDFGWAGFNDTLNKLHLDTVMPNKLFEYISCGLPVISFQHKSLQRFLETHHLGLVINEVPGLIERLKSPETVTLRDNVHAHRWNFTVEANIESIVDIYRHLCEEAIFPVSNGHRLEQKSGVLTAGFRQREN
ncbi:glycosyltransferase [Thermodesulfobacteriota bacterium]